MTSIHAPKKVRAPNRANYRIALMAVTEEVYGPMSLPEMTHLYALLRQADERKACCYAMPSTGSEAPQ